MLNHITIMGRLTKDPEMRRTGSGIAVASFTVAVDRDFKSNSGEKETDFIDCVAWRGTGEFVERNFSKGKMIVVAGRLQIRGWTDKDGNKRKTAEIVADNVYFGEAKNSDSGSIYTGFVPNATSFDPLASATHSNGAAERDYPPANDFAMLTDEDMQLPF